MKRHMQRMTIWSVPYALVTLCRCVWRAHGLRFKACSLENAMTFRRHPYRGLAAPDRDAWPEPPPAVSFAWMLGDQNRSLPDLPSV